jgi:hypothetical protein
MFKPLLIFFLLICCHALVDAGNGIDLNRRNAVYFEGGGSGFLGSLNYERIFYIKNTARFCGRIGLAIHPDALIGVSDAGTFFLTPIGATILAGDEKNFFEAGLSWTHDYNSYKAYVYESNGDSKVDTYHDDYFFVYLGYRYHGKSGFLFRAAATPAFSYRTDTHRMASEKSDKKLEAVFWAGVSFGYIF